MMKIVKRWTTSLVTSFDSMISQIENHEALVSAAIREVQDANTKARVHHARVTQDGQRMRKRLIELGDQAVTWKERARRSAQSDEARALECLRRTKRIESEIGIIEEREREHARMEKQLGEDLRLLEEKLTILKQQRNIMRTRESRAQALSLMQQDDSRIIGEIDDIFDRWEAKLSVYEGSAPRMPIDELEEEMHNSEEEESLRAALQALRAEHAAS